MSSNSHSSTAKDFFAYLLAYILFYVGVISFITLLWQVIGIRFPDPMWFSYQSSYDTMRSSISSLIVAWPVFLILARFIAKDLVLYPEKLNLLVRKWLSNFTIFVSALTMIIDLITLIHSFLGGELTTRFVLKVLVILGVSAAVFGYEFWELKAAGNDPKRRLMAAGSVAVILASIILGFVFVGSPMTARQIRLDDQRVSDLQGLQYQITDYWTRTSKLPEKLNDLIDPLYNTYLSADPESKEFYTYKKTGDLSFEICADFSRETSRFSAQNSSDPSRKPYAYPTGEGGFSDIDSWNHTKGITCFSRTIDPARHKAQVQPAM